MAGIYTYRSPNVKSITGFGPRELIGSSQLDFMAPHDMERVGAIFSDLAMQEKEISLMEYTFIFQDGRFATFERNGSPILNENGILTGYRRIDRDITGRKLAEEHLSETARLASIGVLAAGVAHEINNRPTSVLLYTEQVLMDEVPDTVPDSVLTVNQQAQRMGRIVKNLLGFARHSEPERRDTSIVSMVRSALALKTYDFTVNNVTLIDDCLPEGTSDVLHAMIDENQMIQVVLNLLNNAEQSCIFASKKVETPVSAEVSDDGVIIGVEDNGFSIGMEDLPKICDPFFTTKDIG